MSLTLRLRVHHVDSHRSRRGRSRSAPRQVAGRDREDRRFTKATGNSRWPTLFEVSGDPSDGRIDMEGDLAGVHSIGYGMKSGEIHVHGNAGRHVGGAMSGGRITVEGNAGDFAGCEMRGGLIQIAGSAGNRIGASYPGSKKG